MIKINRVNSYRNIRVAKYIRLSREDGDDRESESVENQSDIIDNYILGHKEIKQITNEFLKMKKPNKMILEKLIERIEFDRQKNIKIKLTFKI